MPSEVRRSGTGVYVLYLAQALTADELTATAARLTGDAAGADAGPLVVDILGLANPLSAATLLAGAPFSGVTHWLVADTGRNAAVLAARLAQLTPVPVELHSDAAAALARANGIKSQKS